jgi:hypothetical protein
VRLGQQPTDASPNPLPHGREDQINAVAASRPDLTVSLRLDAHAPRAARSYVALVDRPSPDLRDAVMLATGELVAQAVQRRQSKSTTDVELRVWMPAGVVRVELQGPCDLLPRRDGPRESHEVLLIENLADRWAIDRDQHHTCAWFEIDRQQPHAAHTT